MRVNFEVYNRNVTENKYGYKMRYDMDNVKKNMGAKDRICMIITKYLICICMSHMHMSFTLF